MKKRKKYNKLENKIRKFAGLSSKELEDSTLRTMRAEQLLRIRRIHNWSESTDEKLHITITEQISIENAFGSVGNDFKDALQQILEDCHEETKQKITCEIAKKLIAAYQ